MSSLSFTKVGSFVEFELGGSNGAAKRIFAALDTCTAVLDYTSSTVTFTANGIPVGVFSDDEAQAMQYVNAEDMYAAFQAVVQS